MAGELITLPLRVGVRSAQLMLRASEEVGGRAANVLVTVAARVLPIGSEVAEPPPQPSDEAAFDPRRPSVPEAEPQPSPPPPGSRAVGAPPEARAAASPPPPPAVTEPPAHVTEQPEMVRDVAEPGAEDGAGAQVTVSEPWEGYASMGAEQVITRLSEATPAELAAVKLYESANRNRQTVLSAVDRQLKMTTGRAQPE